MKKSADDVLWDVMTRDCVPAIERGIRERVPLTDFLRDALIRRYGDAWYKRLEEKVAAVHRERQ